MAVVEVEVGEESETAADDKIEGFVGTLAAAGAKHVGSAFVVAELTAQAVEEEQSLLRLMDQRQQDPHHNQPADKAE